MSYVTTVNNLKEFIAAYEDAVRFDFSDRTKRLYFRGEDDDYKGTKCLPSLFRKEKDEHEIYYKFLRRHPEDFGGLSNLDILSKMQHYGIPTRMLDITTNPLVALFFACYGEKLKADGHVYIFYAEKENVLTYDSDKALLLATFPKTSDNSKKEIKQFLLSGKATIITPEILKDPDIPLEQREAFGRYIYECERERDAFKEHHVDKHHLSNIYFVKPQFSSLRMKLQNSLFMLFGIPNSPFVSDRDFFSEKVDRKSVKDIIISATSKEAILSELKFVCGISYSSLFGDLEATLKEDKEKLYETFIEKVLTNR